MKIVNTEVILAKIENPNSEYFETELKKRGVNFIRWAVVKVNADNFVLNVAHKTKD